MPPLVQSERPELPATALYCAENRVAKGEGYELGNHGGLPLRLLLGDHEGGVAPTFIVGQPRGGGCPYGVWFSSLGVTGGS